MLIETDNLIIRDIAIEDVANLFPILSSARTMVFWPVPFTIDGVNAWVRRSLDSYAEHGFGRYALLLKESGELVGDCGIIRMNVAGDDVNDLGYILHHEHWGKGFATEVASAIKEYAFDTLRLDSLHANMPHDHHASRRVAEKIGMKKIREFDNVRNRDIRTLLYGVERESA
jgi:ribosomal-protein-alanine N-acetyltransferase